MENSEEKAATEELVNRYIKAYKDKIDLYREQDELLKRLDDLEKQEVIFKDIMARCYGKNVEKEDIHHSYPIILGAAMTRMSVTNLGRLPDAGDERFHSKTAIYPVGFTMKRKYTMHKHYKRKAKSKVTYTCSISREHVFCIKADDGHKWEGENCWEAFRDDFDGKMKFRSIEEFFGFTHTTLQQLIEGLGDTSQFKNYVPLEKRKSASKDA